MGNSITQCLSISRRHIKNTNSLLISQEELFNPISTAIRMVNTPHENDMMAMSLVLSNDVNTVVNYDHTEVGLKCLIEYLQLSLPFDCPLMGSVTILILRDETLPSKLILEDVSEILGVKILTECLEKFIITNHSQKGDKSSHQINCECQNSNDICLHQNAAERVEECLVSLDSNDGDPQESQGHLKHCFNIDLILLKARNACLLIDCLATLCCGPNMDSLLNKDIMDFLITCCRLSDIDIEKTDGYQAWSIVLRAILCFERFALTRNCKNTICEYLVKNDLLVPFWKLELYYDSKNMLQREVGFVAQWLLDNMYVNPNRTYTYLKTDRTNLNAVMNVLDSSQYIKFSPIGLEVRCDSDNLESVRCTFCVNQGVYYYETKVITDGIMQIGWATKNCQFMTHEGQGIGDDSSSVSYDGFRRVIWYNGIPKLVKDIPKWKPGDILGCLIDVTEKFVVFFLNGKRIKKHCNLFSKFSSGFYAAASLINNQQCLFNFGRELFKYPPKRQFRTFNRDGNLGAKLKIILPRSIHLAEINQSLEEIDDPCGICFMVSSEVCLEPCNHAGFCKTCISKVESCPLCRSAIKAIHSDPIYFPQDDYQSCNYRPPSRIITN